MVAGKIEEVQYKAWLDDYSVINGLTPYERAERESIQYQLKSVQVLSGVGNYFKKSDSEKDE